MHPTTTEIAAGDAAVAGAANVHGKLPGGRADGKKHGVGKLLKEMWPVYLIEVIVIILGISITLALEEWRDHHKERQLETVYRRNLLSDIQADLRSLDFATDQTQQLLKKGNELLAFVNQPSGVILPAPRADTNLSTILQRPNFLSNDATFSDLKSSGNLHLLEDLQLKNLLFAYYSQTQNIKNVQEAEQQATIVIAGPYFIKRFALGAVGSQPPLLNAAALKALSTDVEFRNNLLLRIGNRQELLEDYRRADSLALRLKERLGEAGGSGDD